MRDQQFKRIIGTIESVFQRMRNALVIAHENLHEAGGKPPDLMVGDKLIITLQYYTENGDKSAGFPGEKAPFCHRLKYIANTPLTSSDTTLEF